MRLVVTLVVLGVCASEALGGDLGGEFRAEYEQGEWMWIQARELGANFGPGG